METYLYNLLYQQEKTYWWSVSRRALVVELWTRLSEGKPIERLLDAGCGTGALLEALRPFGYTVGLDFFWDALRFCAKRRFQGLTNGSAARLPFRDGAFDVVFCLDTVEHIADDHRVFREFHRILTTQGYCVMTVPAWPFLWSERDVRLQHKRRYTKRELVAKVETSGLRIVKCSYFSLFYFPILAALVLVRRRSRSIPRIGTDIAAVPRLLNALFITLLSFESLLLRWIDYPFGVSLLCIAQKPGPESATYAPAEAHPEVHHG